MSKSADCSFSSTCVNLDVNFVCVFGTGSATGLLHRKRNEPRGVRGDLGSLLFVFAWLLSRSFVRLAGWPLVVVDAFGVSCVVGRSMRSGGSGDSLKCT